jgi:hypothetical protein
MGKGGKASTKQVYRTAREFELAMFPGSVAQRAERDEQKHPRDAGVRLAEEVLSGLKSPKAVSGKRVSNGAKPSRAVKN